MAKAPFISRRRMLSDAATLFGIGIVPALMTATHAEAAAGPYKALICLGLPGGVDMLGTVIPTGPEAYGQYAQTREGIATPREALLPLTPRTPQAIGPVGLHPAMPNLARLFNQGHAALVAGLGPLVAPVTLNGWRAGTVAQPRQLGSHEDQYEIWGQLRAEGDAGTGWGGRLIEQLEPLNPLLMSLSTAGNAPFLVGNRSGSFAVDTSEGDAFLYYGDFALQRLVVSAPLASDNLLVRSYGEVNERLGRGVADLNRAMLPTGALPRAGGNPLIAQLHKILRILGGHGSLGIRRQIGYAVQGGWDTHSAQSTTLPALLGTVDQALGWFWEAAGALGLREQITLFTISEFGRSVIANGDGTDHAWGSHQLVLGGAVRGGEIYGALPEMVPDSGRVTKEGWLLPSYAVEQYAATLGRWMGADAGTLSVALPNLRRFEAEALPFL